MIGRLLLVLTTTLACEVSRDLRPERFSCDAGGPCGQSASDGGTQSTNDAGAIETTCPTVGPCPCRAGQECELICVAACQPVCETGSTCTVLCSSANCDVTCQTGAICNLECNAADCAASCESGATCTTSCILSTCACTGDGCP